MYIYIYIYNFLKCWLAKWLVGWFREKSFEHAKIRSTAQQSGAILRTWKFQLKLPTPTPSSLLFTWRHLKVRVVVFSCELFTSTRITGIKEACVCVSVCVCLGGGLAPNEVTAITRFTPECLFSLRRLGKTTVDSGIFSERCWLLPVSAGTLKSKSSPLLSLWTPMTLSQPI